jgi:hypothetical protein
MASETQKKPQKEPARRENKQQKAARFAERKHERERTDNKLEQEPNAEKPLFRLEPQGKPIYFSRAATPRYPNRKSEITLYNVKSS